MSLQKTWYLHLAVRIPDSQSGHAGSNPAGITIWCLGLTVKIPDCLSGDTGSIPVDIAIRRFDVDGNPSACHAEVAGSSPVCSSRKTVPSSRGKDVRPSI